jgi:hypothetical protein
MPVTSGLVARAHVALRRLSDATRAVAAAARRERASTRETGSEGSQLAERSVDCMNGNVRAAMAAGFP